MERDREDDGGLVSAEGEEGRGLEVEGGGPGMKCDKGCKLDSNLQCRV